MPFKSKVSANIGLSASPTTITDTVASTYAHTVIGLSLANTSGNTINVSVKMNKNGGSNCFLIKDAPVYAGSSLIIIGSDQKCVLEAGDSITAYSSASSTCDAAVSYLSLLNT